MSRRNDPLRAVLRLLHSVWKDPACIGGRAVGNDPSKPLFPHSWNEGTSTLASESWAGSNQPLAHAQFVSNFVDYGMSIQAALEAPRFTIPDTGSRIIGCNILVESRVAPDVLQQLRQKGHQLRVRKEYSAKFCNDGQGTSCTSRLEASNKRRGVRSSCRRCGRARTTSSALTPRSLVGRQPGTGWNETRLRQPGYEKLLLGPLRRLCLTAYPSFPKVSDLL